MSGIVYKQISGNAQAVLNGDLIVTGNIIAATINSVTSTQLGYLSGATSNIQTQLNNTVSLNNTILTGNTTCSAVTVSGNVSAGGTVSVSGNLTVTGNITAAKFGAATSAEVGYLSGVTSNIQTQITNSTFTNPTFTNPTFTGTATFSNIQTTVLNKQAMALYEISTTGIIQCPTPVPLYVRANTTTGIILYLPNPLQDGLDLALVPNGTIINLFGDVAFTVNGSYTGTGSFLKQNTATAVTRTVAANSAAVYRLYYYNGIWTQV